MKLIYCVTKEKGKNGSSLLSLLSLITDSNDLGVPLGSRSAFLWMGVVIVIVTVVWTLVRFCRSPSFLLRAEGQSWIYGYRPVPNVSHTDCRLFCSDLWDPCCPHSLEQSLLLLGLSFLKRLFFHDFVLIRPWHRRRGLNYFLLFREIRLQISTSPGVVLCATENCFLLMIHFQVTMQLPNTGLWHHNQAEEKHLQGYYNIPPYR